MTTATTTGARARDDALIASDDAGASAVAADPPLSETSSGYRGTRERPWQDLQDDGRLTGYDATQPGNVVQGARTALDGRRRQDMTLAIGFGHDAAPRRLGAAGSLASGFATARGRVRRRLGRVPRDAEGAAGVGREDAAALRALRAGPRRPGGQDLPRRPDRLAVDAVDLGHADARAGPAVLRPLPPRVAARPLPRVDRAEGGRRRRRRPRAVEYLWQVQKPAGDWWQNTRVNGTQKWATEQMDQVSLPIVLAWWLGMTGADDWPHVQRAADYLVANGPRTPNERWENQDGYSPNTIAAEIAGLVCAADIARRNGAAEKAATYERPPTPGAAASRAGPRPPTARIRPAVLPADHQGRETNAARRTRWATTSRGRSTSARSSTTRSSA